MAKDDFDDFGMDMDFDMDLSKETPSETKHSFFKDLASGFIEGAVGKMDEYLPAAADTRHSMDEMRETMRNQRDVIRQNMNKVGEVLQKGVIDNVRETFKTIKSSKNLKDVITNLDTGLNKIRKDLAYAIDADTAASLDDEAMNDDLDFSSSTPAATGTQVSAGKSTSMPSTDAETRLRNEKLGLDPNFGIQPEQGGYGGTTVINKHIVTNKTPQATKGDMLKINAEQLFNTALRETIISSSSQLIANNVKLFKEQVVLDNQRHIEKMNVMQHIAESVDKSARIFAEQIAPKQAEMTEKVKKMEVQLTDLIALERDSNTFDSLRSDNSKKTRAKRITDFTSSGAIDIGGLYSHMSEQLKESANNMGLDMILGMKDMLPMMLMGGGRTSLGKLIGKGAGTVAMMPFKEALGKLNDRLETFVPDMMMKGLQYMKDKGGILGSIAEMSGIKTGTDKTVSFEKRNRRTNFDMVTRTAITEVIPGYLAKIYSAVSHTEELAFDYKNLRFTGAKQLRQENDREIRNAGMMSMSGTKHDILNAGKENKALGLQELIIDQDELDKILVNIVSSGRHFDPTHINEELVFKGVNKAAQENFKRMLKRMPRQELEKLNINASHARASRDRVLEEKGIELQEYGMTQQLSKGNIDNQIADLKRKKWNLDNINGANGGLNVRNTEEYMKKLKENAEIDKQIKELELTKLQSADKEKVSNAADNYTSKIYDLLLNGIVVYSQPLGKNEKRKLKELRNQRSEEISSELKAKQAREAKQKDLDDAIKQYHDFAAQNEYDLYDAVTGYRENHNKAFISRFDDIFGGRVGKFLNKASGGKLDVFRQSDTYKKWQEFNNKVTGGINKLTQSIDDGTLGETIKNTAENAYSGLMRAAGGNAGGGALLPRVFNKAKEAISEAMAPKGFKDSEATPAPAAEPQLETTKPTTQTTGLMRAAGGNAGGGALLPRFPVNGTAALKPEYVEPTTEELEFEKNKQLMIQRTKVNDIRDSLMKTIGMTPEKAKKVEAFVEKTKSLMEPDKIREEIAKFTETFGKDDHTPVANTMRILKMTPDMTAEAAAAKIEENKRIDKAIADEMDLAVAKQKVILRYRGALEEKIFNIEHNNLTNSLVRMYSKDAQMQFQKDIKDIQNATSVEEIQNIIHKQVKNEEDLKKFETFSDDEMKEVNIRAKNSLNKKYGREIDTSIDDEKIRAEIAAKHSGGKAFKNKYDAKEEQKLLYEIIEEKGESALSPESRARLRKSYKYGFMGGIAAKFNDTVDSLNRFIFGENKRQLQKGTKNIANMLMSGVKGLPAKMSQYIFGGKDGPGLLQKLAVPMLKGMENVRHEVVDKLINPFKSVGTELKRSVGWFARDVVSNVGDRITQIFGTKRDRAMRRVERNKRIAEKLRNWNAERQAEGKGAVGGMLAGKLADVISGTAKFGGKLTSIPMSMVSNAALKSSTKRMKNMLAAGRISQEEYDDWITQQDVNRTEEDKKHEANRKAIEAYSQRLNVDRIQDEKLKNQIANYDKEFGDLSKRANEMTWEELKADKERARAQAAKNRIKIERGEKLTEEEQMAALTVKEQMWRKQDDYARKIKEEMERQDKTRDIEEFNMAKERTGAVNKILDFLHGWSDKQDKEREEYLEDKRHEEAQAKIAHDNAVDPFTTGKRSLDVDGIGTITNKGGQIERIVQKATSPSYGLTLGEKGLERAIAIATKAANANYPGAKEALSNLESARAQIEQGMDKAPRTKEGYHVSSVDSSIASQIYKKTAGRFVTAGEAFKEGGLVGLAKAGVKGVVNDIKDVAALPFQTIGSAAATTRNILIGNKGEDGHYHGGLKDKIYTTGIGMRNTIDDMRTAVKEDGATHAIGGGIKSLMFGRKRDSQTGLVEGSRADMLMDKKKDLPEQQLTQLEEIKETITGMRDEFTERDDRDQKEKKKSKKEKMKEGFGKALDFAKKWGLPTLGLGAGAASLAAGGIGLANWGKNIFRRTKEEGITGFLGEATGIDSSGDSRFNSDGTYKTKFQMAKDRFKAGRWLVGKHGAKLAVNLVKKNGGKLGKNFAELGAKIGGKVAKTGAGTVLKKSGGKIISTITAFLSKPSIAKHLPKGAIKHIADAVGKRAIQEAGKGVAKGAAKTLLKNVAGFVTGGGLTAALAAADFVSGMHDAPRYFKVSKGMKITAKMRVTAGLCKALTNLLFGIIPADWLTKTIYNLIATDEEKQDLEQGQQDLVSRAYSLGADVDPTRLNELENKTLGKKFFNLFKSKNKIEAEEAKLMGMDIERYREFKKDYDAQLERLKNDKDAMNKIEGENFEKGMKNGELGTSNLVTGPGGVIMNNPDKKSDKQIALDKLKEGTPIEVKGVGEVKNDDIVNAMKDSVNLDKVKMMSTKTYNTKKKILEEAVKMEYPGAKDALDALKSSYKKEAIKNVAKAALIGGIPRLLFTEWKKRKGEQNEIELHNIESGKDIDLGNGIIVNKASLDSSIQASQNEDALGEMDRKARMNLLKVLRKGSEIKYPGADEAYKKVRSFQRQKSWDAAKAKLKDVGKSVWNGAKKVLGVAATITGAKQLWNAGKFLVKGASKAIGIGMGAVAKFASEGGNKVKEGVKEALTKAGEIKDKVFGKVSDAVHAMGEGISNGLGKAGDFFKGIFSSLTNFFKDKWEKIKNWGKNLIEGAKDFKDDPIGFMSEKAASLKDAVADKIEGVKNSAIVRKGASMLSTATNFWNNSKVGSAVNATLSEIQKKGLAKWAFGKIKGAGDAVKQFWSNRKKTQNEIDSALRSDPQSVIALASQITGGIKGQTKNIGALSPEMAKRVNAFLNDPRVKGQGVSIRESVRSPAVQLAYYSKSRASKDTTDQLMKIAGFPAGAKFWGGEVSNPVTWTIASNHFDGNAVDLEPGKIGYDRLGKIAKEYGLEWGGDWAGHADKPHFQLDKNVKNIVDDAWRVDQPASAGSPIESSSLQTETKGGTPITQAAADIGQATTTTAQLDMSANKQAVPAPTQPAVNTSDSAGGSSADVGSVVSNTDAAIETANYSTVKKVEDLTQTNDPLTSNLSSMAEQASTAAKTAESMDTNTQATQANTDAMNRLAAAMEQQNELNKTIAESASSNNSKRRVSFEELSAEADKLARKRLEGQRPTTRAAQFSDPEYAKLWHEMQAPAGNIGQALVDAEYVRRYSDVAS